MFKESKGLSESFTQTEARGAEKADQSVARMISEGSSTLGDVYGQVSALESVMSMIQSK
ncbi:hypothetical protein [Chlamydia serpentis]|uniref:hypothetical protein n=1 Tax=Chlamydia serpentis TaxID=1967782 RepID=UPI0013002B2B|nr:hypothetical protein [Chlamydia serpentis]